MESRILLPINPKSPIDDILNRIMSSTSTHILFEQTAYPNIVIISIKVSSLIYLVRSSTQNSLLAPLVADNQNLSITRSLTDEAYLIGSSGTSGPKKLIMCTFEGLPQESMAF